MTGPNGITPPFHPPSLNRTEDTAPPRKDGAMGDGKGTGLGAGARDGQSRGGEPGREDRFAAAMARADAPVMPGQAKAGPRALAGGDVPPGLDAQEGRTILAQVPAQAGQMPSPLHTAAPPPPVMAEAVPGQARVVTEIAERAQAAAMMPTRAALTEARTHATVPLATNPLGIASIDLALGPSVISVTLNLALPSGAALPGWLAAAARDLANRLSCRLTDRDVEVAARASADTMSRPAFDPLNPRGHV